MPELNQEQFETLKGIILLEKKRVRVPWELSDKVISKLEKKISKLQRKHELPQYFSDFTDKLVYDKLNALLNKGYLLNYNNAWTVEGNKRIQLEPYTTFENYQAGVKR